MKKRFFSLLLCFSLVLGAAAYRPPRADAFAVSGTAIGAIVAGVAAASGIHFLSDGMDASGLADYWGNQITGFCDSIGETVSDWWEGLGEDPVALGADNRFILRAPAYAAVQSVLNWWRGENEVEEGTDSLSLLNSFYYAGQYLPFTTNSVVLWNKHGYKIIDPVFSYPSGSSDGMFWKKTYPSSSQGSFSIWENGELIYSNTLYFSICGVCVCPTGYSDPSRPRYQLIMMDCDYSQYGRSYSFELRNTASAPASLSVSQPDTYTELEVPEDAPGVALDVGLTGALDLDAALQEILEKLSANELTATQTVAEEGSEEGEEEEDSPYLPYIPRIFQKLEALPDTISEKIHDLFVPSEEFVEALPAQFADVFDSRCGLLTYPASLLADFFTRLSTLTVQDPVFSWNNIYEPFSNTLLIPAGSYNLNSAVQSEAMQSVYSIYLVVVKALVALWFVDLCRRKYNQIINK